MKLTAYTDDTIEAIALKIDNMLDSIADLESDIMNLVDDDQHAIFHYIDDLRLEIDELCGYLADGGS
jgi:hypothetical protein